METEIATSAGAARVAVERPSRTRPRLLVVLTHGAGGTPDTPDVLAVRDAAGDLGAVTALVTQPYRVRGGRAPGSAARQDAAWIEIVTALRADNEGLPLVQGGRSNGARVACRTAREAGAVGVIALAFPLRPPGRPAKSRDAELRAAGTRVLVLNGDRDPFGVPEPDDATRVVVLPGETHALSRNPSAIGEAVAGWLGTLPGLDRHTAVVPRLPLVTPWSGRGYLVAVAPRPVRGDGRPVGQQLTGVLEDDNTVAEQAPALLRVTGYRVRRLAVGCCRIRARRNVRAHVSASWFSLCRPTVCTTWLCT